MTQPKKSSHTRQPEANQLATAPLPKLEAQLLGRRVQVRTLDWQRSLTGQLLQIEKYLIILRLDSSATLAIYKHSIGTIGLAAEKAETKE